MNNQIELIKIMLNDDLIGECSVEYIKQLSLFSGYLEGFFQTDPINSDTINIQIDSPIIDSFNVETKNDIINLVFVLLSDELKDINLKKCNVDMLIGILLVNDFMCPISENNLIWTNKIESMIMTLLSKNNEWVDVLFEAYNTENLRDKIINAYMDGSLDI